MKILICLCPLVQMSNFSKVNENRWQLWDFLPLFLLSMIKLRPRFYLVLRYHLSRRPLAGFFALRYHPLLHLPLYLPRQAVLLLDRPLSQRGNEIEPVVQAITLEGLVLEVLFVIYYHKPDHVIRDCKKQHNRNQKFQSAHIASTTKASDQSIQFSDAELARFQLYQGSLRSPSTLITVIAESGNPNKCLVSSSSSKWVIDFGATYHMTGNSSLLFTFQSQPSPSNVTLADGSHSCVLGSGIIVPTPSIPLTSVLSLPNFSFNLMSISKLTRALKCYILFFPDFCLLQDLMTKQIIGRGRESRGLYILDPTVSRPIACSGVTTPFKTHCQLSHLSLPLLKKLCPWFSSFLSLDCESCQFAKHHRLSYSPRVNKRASAPFELVHSDMWGLCLVLSPTGFRYFVTFVDNFS